MIAKNVGDIFTVWWYSQVVEESTKNYNQFYIKQPFKKTDISNDSSNSLPPNSRINLQKIHRITPQSPFHRWKTNNTIHIRSFVEMAICSISGHFLRHSVSLQFDTKWWAITRTNYIKLVAKNRDLMMIDGRPGGAPRKLKHLPHLPSLFIENLIVFGANVNKLRKHFSSYAAILCIKISAGAMDEAIIKIKYWNKFPWDWRTRLPKLLKFCTHFIHYCGKIIFKLLLWFENYKRLGTHNIFSQSDRIFCHDLILSKHNLIPKLKI